MRILPKRPFFSIALIVSLAAVLVALAVLQYRWSGQISKAEHERMRSSLRASMDQFSQQFNNEFRQLLFSIQPNPTVLNVKNWWIGYAADFDSLPLRTSNHHLVRNIYLLVPASKSGSQLLKLNRTQKAFEAAPWPSNFESIRERYERYFSSPADQEFRPYMSSFLLRIPLMVQPLIAFQGQFPGTMQGRSGAPAGGTSGRGGMSGGRTTGDGTSGRGAPGRGAPNGGAPGGGAPGRGGPGRGAPGRGMQNGVMQNGGMPGNGMQWAGFLLIEIDLDSLRNELFPELAQRYFKDTDYQVAVIGGHEHDTFLYQSDPHLTIASFNSADAKIGLLENRFSSMMSRSERDFDSPGRGRDFDSPGRAPDRGVGPLGAQPRPEPPGGGGRGRRGPPAFNDPYGWELAAKHRVGSLDAAVAATRRRNLEFSFGSLLLLAVSTAFIIISARRAQSLARLQIDFVAGISHELRTPLAVICSAGDNLAEGVVADENSSTRKYGELIRNEGRKLTGMVEQILQYAGGQIGRRRYSLRPEHLNDIVDAALNQVQPALVEAGFSIEKSFASDLPRINVDAAALSQAIQNLIQNALKYSGQSRWLAIRTAKVPGKCGADAQLTIEDKGIGIASADLPHIFEPFYRGNEAVSAQIHGTGLGLYMVREALISMGGNISAKSSPGEGTIFTIVLPALPDSEDPPANEG
jgi:signal transduction histidine kinase